MGHGWPNNFIITSRYLAGQFMLFQSGIVLLIAAFFDAVVVESGVGGVLGRIMAVLFWVLLACGVILLLVRWIRGPDKGSEAGKT